MPFQIQDIIDATGMAPETLALAGLAAGVLLLVYGLSLAAAGPTAKQRRLHAIAGGGTQNSGQSVLRLDDNDPTGLLRAFVPRSQKERSDIAKRLRQAGVHRKNAVLYYFFARTALGIALPGAFIGLLFFSDGLPMPEIMRGFLNGLAWTQTLYILTFLVLVGFFIPTLWLKSKIDERRLAVELGLPNALDLLTVAVEAGLGFDAAMTRVAKELIPVAPAIAEEFTILQLELQAGKDRQRAFLALAERVNVDEVTAFSNVIVQSMQFGTSVSAALTGYAVEMRTTRELRAQEKANKLPVKMSVVLAGLMMPVLLIICLTPVLIRWVRMFADMQ